MLLRIALFVAAVFALLGLLRSMTMARRAKRSKLSQAGPNGSNSPNGSARSPTNTQKSTPLLPCAHCGAHAPQPEGVLHNGHFYCSLDHAQAAMQTQRKPPQ